MAKVEEKVFALARPVVEKEEFELVDVEYVKEGTEWFLRIFIDKPEGIHIDDCEAISRILDPLLDEVDYIPMAYHLEVSSPGIERVLKTTEAFQRFIGEMVNIVTYTAINGKKKHLGKLVSASEDEIVIDEAGEENIIISRDKIAKANLAWVEKG